MVLSLIVGSLALSAAVLTGIIGYCIDRNTDVEESMQNASQTSEMKQTSEMNVKAGRGQ
jgi:hypothetical protein